MNTGNETFPKIRLNALVKLLISLKKKYKINPKYVLGHEDISPKRKIDPGPKFPWRKLYNQNLSKKR